MDKSFFGLHDGTNLSYNHLNVGAVRLWDVGVTWKNLEVSPGVFDFTRMDSLVNAALAEGAAITYVLGRVPSFYDTVQTNMPPLDKFDAYVRAVVSRYAGKINAYQVWNEANVNTFFTGTTADMARLTKVVGQAINQLDPAALVIAPSGPLRMGYQRLWYQDYFNQDVDGYKPWRWIDRVGFSMYPSYGLGPEDMFDSIAKMRSIMDATAMPNWKKVPHASEINYDVESGATVSLLSDIDQMDYLIRTYLVGACAGFERMHWYRYDWGFQNSAPLGNTYLTDPTNFDSVTPAGLAFNRVKSWMSGDFGGYSVDSVGTYKAKFGNKVVFWNPTQSVKLTDYSGYTMTRYNGTTLLCDNSVWVQRAAMVDLNSKR